MNFRRVKEYLKLVTTWEATGNNLEFYNVDGRVDTLNNSNVIEDQIEEYCRLVWSSAAFEHTYSNRLIVKVTTKSTDTYELNTLRDKL